MKNTISSRTRARLLLLLTVAIWGSSFVTVKAALTDASPLLFNLMRMSLASLVLLALNGRLLRGLTARQLGAGAVAGFFLGLGYQLQTLGLSHTTAAKSAFLTGLVVVFVPLIGLLPWFHHTMQASSRWLAGSGAILAFMGLVLLTTPAGSSFHDLLREIGLGDFLTLLCALAFALHLLTLARISSGLDPGLLALLQISVAALLMLFTLPFEPAHHAHFTPRLLGALGITSILSTAFAFSVQSYAQQHLLPTETSLLLTLEPVIAALTSLFLLGERMSLRALTGAVLILFSIGVVELAPQLLHTRELPS